MLSRSWLAAGVLLALGAMQRPAEACSICRCGDPTFNSLGKDGYSPAGFSAALDWERFDKDEGNPAEDAESQIEDRFTALVSYGFGERFGVYLRVPYSVRNLRASEFGEEPGSTETHGFSDPELYGQIRLWASGMSPLGRRTSVSLNAGIKAPWGRNELRQDGERVDEHAQPGTGSTDLLGSLALLHLLDRHSSVFVSAGYRHMGENAFEYRYGSIFTASAAYERKLGDVLDAVVELDFRHASRDRAVPEGLAPVAEVGAFGPVPDEDTGGSLLYVTPRLLLDLGGGLVARATAQIPLARDLHGFQTERTVLNLGLTYLFSR